MSVKRYGCDPRGVPSAVGAVDRSFEAHPIIDKRLAALVPMNGKGVNDRRIIGILFVDANFNPFPRFCEVRSESGTVTVGAW